MVYHRTVFHLKIFLREMLVGNAGQYPEKNYDWQFIMKNIMTGVMSMV